MKSSSFILASAFSLGSAARGLSYRTTGTPSVQVKNGTLNGVHSSAYNQDFFLGIPFAQPPVGDLRFRRPQSLNTTWESPRVADQYAPSCIGYGSDQWGYPISEDCLYLNVVRPAGYEGQALPVGFWIHGGGFSQGGGADRRYNTSFIVQNSVEINKPIIAVTVSYRLAGWGFLNSRSIAEEGNTNSGLRDQRIALEWVKENIAAFGGDPSKVTIFGESAGAGSVAYQITAFGGRDDNLFRAGILQSGNPINYNTLATAESLEFRWTYLVAAVGCSQDLNTNGCLRRVPTEQMNAILNTTSQSYSISIDGDFVQDYQSTQIANGAFVKVPIIIGANSDEGASFGARGINTTEQLRDSMAQRRWPAAAIEDLLVAYPDDLSVNVIDSLGDQRPAAEPYGLQFRRSASIYGDSSFVAGRRATCQAWASNNLTAYCYRFNAIPAGPPGRIGVNHFDEVAFVFNNVNGEGYGLPISVKPFEGKPESYAALSELMSKSWASYIYDLDPNNWQGRGEVEAWPQYSLDNPRDFVWDANVTSYAEADTYRAEGMAIFNRYPPGSFGR